MSTDELRKCGNCKHWRKTIMSVSECMYPRAMMPVWCVAGNPNRNTGRDSVCNCWEAAAISELIARREGE